MLSELARTWRVFRPSSPILLRADGVEAPPQPGRLVAITRALTPYRCLSLPAGVPRDKRFNALRLQALEWSPYARTELMLDIAEDGAGAWIWDSERVESVLRESGLDPSRLRICPETALRRPAVEEVRLVRCLDGVEGQVWRRKQLSASRWWAEVPSEIEWTRFQRASGVDPSELVAAPAALPASGDWLRSPWPSRGNAVSLQSVGIPQIAAAAAIAMLAVTAYQVGKVVRIGHAAAEVRNATDALATSAQPLEIARRQTVAANARAQAIFGLEGAEAQLALMARIAEQLPQNGTTFTSWVYQGNDLSFTIANPTQPIDSTFIIRRIEGIKNLQVGQADLSTDGRTLTMRLRTRPR